MSIAEVPTNRPLSALEEARAVAAAASTSPLGMLAGPETYRQLYVSLDLPMDREPVIGITSAIAGEGRTTVALGLAQTLATDLDMQVLLVDADFIRPALASRLGISASPGLPQVLRGEASLADVVQQVSHKLFVVTTDPAEEDGERLLRQLCDQNPFLDNVESDTLVILDLPSVLEHSYTALAASVTDALVLVIRAGVTPIDIVRKATERLKDRPLQGAVLNGHQPARPPRRLGRRR